MLNFSSPIRKTLAVASSRNFSFAVDAVNLLVPLHRADRLAFAAPSRVWEAQLERLDTIVQIMIAKQMNKRCCVNAFVSRRNFTTKTYFSKLHSFRFVKIVILINLRKSYRSDYICQLLHWQDLIYYSMILICGYSEYVSSKDHQYQWRTLLAEV